MINKVKIVAIDKIREGYIKEGLAEFVKRLRPFFKLEIIELKEEGVKKNEEALEKYISYKTYILDGAGKDYTSEGFSELLRKEEGEVIFIIGGSDGFSLEFKKRVKTISLSKMTFLHEMARLVFIEQLYRAAMINSGRKYHK